MRATRPGTTVAVTVDLDAGTLTVAWTDDLLGDLGPNVARAIPAPIGPARELHRDTGTLPKSRGCAMDYAIYAVVFPYLGGGLENAVAVVSVYPYGFEGPDRRFLVVPFGK